MKASKYTEAQFVFALKQADEGTAITEICRKAGISEATFYVWRKKYGNLLPTEMKRLRQSFPRVPAKQYMSSFAIWSLAWMLDN